MYPRGEFAHAVAIFGIFQNRRGAVQRHGAAITALLVLLCNGQNPLHVLLGHENAGNGAGGGTQVHIDRAAGVVVNDHGLGPSLCRKAVFVRKSAGAPGNKNNLPCHILPVEITLGRGIFFGICCTGRIAQEHKRILRSLSALVQAVPALDALWRATGWSKGGIDLPH